MQPIRPIHIPNEWNDHDLLTFEQFCDLIHIPVRTVRDWRRRRIGPHWTKLEGCGRLYITVIEVRRFLRASTNDQQHTSSTRSERENGAS